MKSGVRLLQATCRLKAEPRTAFITDVEGNQQYFNACIDASPVLERAQGPDARINFKNDCDTFVYGGDVMDKSAEGFAILKSLLDFKKRHPDRVFLIAGNRDTCKIRLTSEMKDTARPPGYPFWANGRIPTWDEWVSKHNASLESRFKYITMKTMGCPDLLAAEGTKDTAETMKRYLKETSPQGVLGKYLTAARLILLQGETLFVHGGLTSENIGFVPYDGVSLYPPPKDGPPGDRYDDVLTWENKLNGYLDKQISDWKSRSEFNERYERGGEGLMGYTFAAPMKLRTVVTVSFLFRGMPKIPCRKTMEYVERNNVKRVVVGHQPHGDCPGVFKHRDLTIIMGDTSYSDPASPDNRGSAHSAVTLGPESVHISGVLHDGARYSFSPADFPLVGRFVVYNNSIWWCKAVLLDTTTYVLNQPHPTEWYSLNHARVHGDYLFPLYCDMP